MSTTIRVGARPARKCAQASTRHLVVGGRFAAILTEHFGIGAGVILDALEGELQRQTITLCAWAAERTEDAAQALRCWAWRRGRGAYRVPSVAWDGIQDDRRDDGRGSGPGRHGGIAPRRSCALDPACIRTNISRMGL